MKVQAAKRDRVARVIIVIVQYLELAQIIVSGLEATFYCRDMDLYIESKQDGFEVYALCTHVDHSNLGFAREFAAGAICAYKV